MGAVKNYLARMIMLGETEEEQDAIEWAIMSDWIRPTLDWDRDRRLILNSLPAAMECWRRQVHQTPELQAA